MVPGFGVSGPARGGAVRDGGPGGWGVFGPHAVTWHGARPQTSDEPEGPEDPDAEFVFGLERVLDGVEVLVRSRTTAS